MAVHILEALLLCADAKQDAQLKIIIGELYSRYTNVEYPAEF